MEEVSLDHPTTISRINSSSAISESIGSDYEIDSLFGVGVTESYVNFSIPIFTLYRINNYFWPFFQYKIGKNLHLYSNLDSLSKCDFNVLFLAWPRVV